jgi:hypothetical protein
VPVVIPELVAVVGLFFAVVGYIVARGLLATWTHSLGFVLQWMGTHLANPHPASAHSRHTRRYRQAVQGSGSRDSHGATNVGGRRGNRNGFFLHGAGRLATLTAQAIDHLAGETADTFEWLVHRHIPRWVKLAIEAAFPLVWLHKIIAHAIAHAIPAVRKEIHTLPERSRTR